MQPTKKGVSQIEKFRDLARELECDESEERFTDALKEVAKAPAPKQPDEKPKRRRQDKADAR